MRAIVYRDYGDPSVLELVERPDPEPAADEVLIRVVAAGVNPVDARLRKGEMRGLLPGGFPRIPGYDVAGVVEAAGSGSGLVKGDRVMAFLDHLYGGGYAELATCTHTSVVPLPEGMAFEEAAALPLAGSTALQSLRDHGMLRQGQRVLILGASGGVGAFAVQIACAYGAQVTGVASGRREEFVMSMGADEFLDYHSQDYTQSQTEWDLIFDAAGKSSFHEAKKVLRRNGNYVTTEPSLRGFIVALITWPLQQRAKPMLARSREEDLGELLRLYSQGKLKITVAESFALENTAEAHRRIENDSFCGKLVLNTNATE